MTRTASSRALPAVSHVPIAVVAGPVGLAASVALYLGLVHAVPLVSWGTTEEEFLRMEGAHQVRLASVVAALAGVLLLAARARWTGGIAVGAAGLLAVLSHRNTVASWGLLLIYVLVLLAGSGAAVERARGPWWNGPHQPSRRRADVRHRRSGKDSS